MSGASAKTLYGVLTSTPADRTPVGRVCRGDPATVLVLARQFRNFIFPSHQHQSQQRFYRDQHRHQHHHHHQHHHRLYHPPPPFFTNTHTQHATYPVLPSHCLKSNTASLRVLRAERGRLVGWLDGRDARLW